MLIKLYVTVNNTHDVLARYSQVRVYRSATVSGVYTEITDADTRIRLQPGVSIYPFFDESGASTYWYKTDFFNPQTLDASSQSDPSLGDDSVVLSGIMSIDELKEVYLFGVDLTSDDGTPYPDRMFEFSIRAAIGWVEDVLDLDVRPTDRVERYDYEQRQFSEWGFLQLDHYPCLDWDVSNHYVKMFWPSAAEAYTFPSEWVRLEKQAGQINLVPTSGSIAQALIVSGALLPTVLSRVPWVPRALEVSYASGFDLGSLPYEIRALIGMRACFPILNTAGDLIAGAGIASYSLGVDSLSQSINTTSSATNSGYGARLVQFTRELKEQVPVIRRRYKNIGLGVLA